MNPPDAIDPIAAADLAAQRDYLLQFARRRVRDAALAEDLVHDVFAAVLDGRARFGARSSLRTWLTGILKHKIVDAVRRRQAECSLDELLEDGGGAWPGGAAAPAGAEPPQLVDQRRRLAAVLERIDTLPPPLRRTFELSVVLGQSTPEVCAALSITRANLWVRLHRARQALGAWPALRSQPAAG
jgi:RNA polymerase sigma-70 factor (ECF subfamily)